MNNKEKLLAKIEKDMHEIESEIKAMTPMQVFDNSYKFACMQEFYGALDFACDFEIDETDEICIDNVEKLINYKGNILKYLVDDGYFNFRHPERFNLFAGYNEALEIVQIVINECMGEEND